VGVVFGPARIRGLYRGKSVKDVFEANDALALYRKELALTDHVSDSPVVRAVKHARRVEVRKVSDMPTANIWPATTHKGQSRRSITDNRCSQIQLLT
jgi:hypothetical protein